VAKEKLPSRAAFNVCVTDANFYSSRSTARYVPNVAKRFEDDRPTTELSFGKISNGHISARGRPIHFMFGFTVWFSGSADRMALFPV